jgi:dCTP deaminase
MSKYGPGVLPVQQLRNLATNGYISSNTPIRQEQYQPASLDLRLGDTAHRLQASFLPGPGASVSSKLDQLGMGWMDLRRPTILERNCIYLVRLQERLALPETLCGKANPKSTTGRLDVFTRVMTDRGAAFDRIAPGYNGPLWLEIVPRTFPIIVRKGECLTQLRLERGDARCTDDDLRIAHRHGGICRDAAGEPANAAIDDGLHVTARIAGDRPGEVIAYRGRSNAPIIDLSRRNHYPPADFWEPVPAPPGGRLILDPGDLYLLNSEERLSVPQDFAAEMVPFDPAVGEFRIHYAGFFDPGFGCSDNQPGTRAVLEVRAHETALSMEHGQRIGRLLYNRMAATPERAYGCAIGSAYNRQGLTLSKQFARE